MTRNAAVRALLAAAVAAAALKRELVAGDLRSPRLAVLPVAVR